MAGYGAPKRFTDEQESKIVAQYNTLQPDGTWNGSKVLARLWKCSPQTIGNVLHRNSVVLRDAKAAHAGGKRCKPITNLPPEGEQPPMCKCACGLAVVWNQRKNHWNAYVEGHYRSQSPRPTGKRADVFDGRVAFYKSPEWLTEQYVTNNRLAVDIARECAVSPAVIYRCLHIFGIPIRSRSAARMGRHIGAANGSWRGGTTPERQRLYKAGHWREFSQAIYRRDGFRCRRCSGPKKAAKGLHAHHLKAWAGHPELRFDAENCVTLCDRCHRWVHSRANLSRDYLG